MTPSWIAGDCETFALALHDRTGWPLVVITDHHNVDSSGRAGGGSGLHWTCERPCDGALIDVLGAHVAESLREAYDGYADDGLAALGYATRADAESEAEDKGHGYTPADAMPDVDHVLRELA